MLSKTSFIEGTSLEDKEFTKLYEEVISCRFTSDKIAILKNNINSITDLIDMLKGEVLKESDYDDYFSSLNNSELSLLLHYSIFKLFPVEYNFICQLNSMNLTDIWQIHLLKYLTKLSPLNIKPILNYLKSLENI